MRRLLALPALALAAFLPGSALAGEGCSHAKGAATSAAAEGAPADHAATCGEGCTHAASAEGHACPHAAAEAAGGACPHAAKATTAATQSPVASPATGFVAEAE